MAFIQRIMQFIKKGLFVTACIVGFVACDPEENNGSVRPLPNTEPTNVLSRAIYATELQLDPHFVRISAEAGVVRDLFLGLMAFDPKGQIQNAVAKEWFSEDGKNWLFILDENAKWSNDQAVTSADFVASWQRLSDPKNASPLAHYLVYMGIVNSRAVLAGELPPDALGVKALNPYTLQVQLEKANYQLPKMLAHSALLPTYLGQKPNSTDLVSNGSYRVEHLEKNLLQLKARDKNTPFQVVQYHLITSVQNPSRFDIIENPLENYHQHEKRFARLCNYFYEFNFNDPLFAQKPIRQAVRAMISPIEISKGNGIPSHLMIPKQLFSEMGHSLSHTNVEQLLNEQGIHSGNPLKLTLSYDRQGQHSQIAERIVRALGQSELFRVQLQAVSWEELLAKREHKDFQLIRSGWCADYPDPVLFLTQFHSQSPDNKSSYSNAKVDELLLQLQEQPLDTAKRQRIIATIAHQLEEDVAILPLFQYQRRMSIAPTIQGFDEQNASETIYSKDLTRQYHKDK
ncbi:peptide ABC transporter substrate-binding protein [Glaesserella parasuis]|uniref:Peptide ABC transporter substrate-binding protein n=1 Tax=Glaesserella parasuis TaxID=738 RepID=A0AAJ6D8S9_GLAPU|nr:peptide ABC transporter substrate-binding protein [Glaesserella parasuis]MCT8569999.1 peptide ABC transporter substrate-binding protein [Glaesserella parasuis]MCT8754984.1 peptide ABC transporter substrate-binding protein [Glaesserella parasuis]MCT8820042.1 peptide ABC transporter substrate-binding protein [Glaesserella parasuis]MDG6360660.1 peptide ABC transporter substrate-binding protein [Glaesserella parasuis]MDO9664792.1 peptide ABC transporter substrate-binding protein [Glaesserella p